MSPLRAFFLLVAFSTLASCNDPQAQKPPNDVTQVTVLSRPDDPNGPTPPPGATDSAMPSATGSAPAPSTTDTGTPAPSHPITPADLKTQGPGTYTVEGFIVRTSICPPCPPRSQCKPCVPNGIYVSAQAPVRGQGDPQDTIDIQVLDPSGYQVGQHYVFEVTVTQSANITTRKLFSATPK